MTYAEQIVAALAESDLFAEVIETGGGCRAIWVDAPGSGHVLVTDGDAALPTAEAGALVAACDSEGDTLETDDATETVPAGASIEDVVDVIVRVGWGE